MNPRKRARPGTRAGLAVAVASTLTLLSGCAQVVDGQAVREAPQIGAPVEWHPCAFTDAAPDYLRSGQCGTITVPVNYDKPDDGIVTLALIRFPATGDKIGSLVINPGGPGESGLEAAMNLVQGMPEAIRQRFDLVGFDPRGVARSKPALWCNSDADNDKSRADQIVEYTPEGVEHMESETKAFVQRCVDKMGKDFLANVGTVNVAKDLDALRASLGDDKLTYAEYDTLEQLDEQIRKAMGKLVLDYEQFREELSDAEIRALKAMIALLVAVELAHPIIEPLPKGKAQPLRPVRLTAPRENEHVYVARSSPGGLALVVFTWTPFQSGMADARVGYRTLIG